MINNEQPQQGFNPFLLTVYLLRKKYYIIIFTVLCLIAGIIYAFSLPNWYKTEINTVPPNTSSSSFDQMMGGLSSTLKDFGLTKLGGGKSDGYSYTVILNSRSILDSIIYQFKLWDEYEISTNKMSQLRKAVSENIDVTAENEGNYVVSVTDKNPQRAADIANAYINIFNNIAQDIFQKESKFNGDFLEKRLAGMQVQLDSIGNALKQYSKNKKVISPMDQAKAVTSTLADLKAELMKQEIVYDIMLNKYGDKDQTCITQKNIIDNLKAKIRDAENKPGFAGNFALDDAAGVGINYLSMYSEFEALSKVKVLLTPMIEDSKLNQNKKVQSLIVLDKAIPPDKKDSPKRSLIVAGFTISGLIISLVYFVLIFSYKIFRKKLKEVNQKFLDNQKTNN